MIELKGGKAVVAFLICLLPVLFGFLIPAAVLGYWSLTQADLSDGSFLELAWNSFYLAFLAALIAVGFALLLAYAGRLSPSKGVRFSIAAAGMGYALPGTIIAVGVIIPFAWFDHQLIAAAKKLVLC